MSPVVQLVKRTNGLISCTLIPFLMFLFSEDRPVILKNRNFCIGVCFDFNSYFVEIGHLY